MSNEEQRKRLIELSKLTPEEILNYFRNRYYTDGNNTENGIVANAVNDILPRMILPPVKIGQTVYSIEPCISQVFVGEVYEIFQSRYGMVCRSSRKGYYSLAFPADSVGKTVFLTKDEAEKALAERSKQ